MYLFFCSFVLFFVFAGMLARLKKLHMLILDSVTGGACHFPFDKSISFAFAGMMARQEKSHELILDSVMHRFL